MLEAGLLDPYASRDVTVRVPVPPSLARGAYRV